MDMLLELLFMLELESCDECPCCGEEIDTGLGFGRRDYECSNDPDACGWNYSVDSDIYRAYLELA